MKIEDLYTHYCSSSGVSIDTRTIQRNEIFFAIKGDNFDGHKFIESAFSKGASYAVIQDEKYNQDSKTILVSDTQNTLQDLARYHRDQLDIPILAITGSNGKTTTKELIYAVLSKKYNVYATEGNYNNHLGVPLTLLSAQKYHDFLIVEMGANHIKEIDHLCHIADPNYGMITNIGRAHIEGFGSVQGIIEGKTELYKYLEKNNGTIFYNDEDQILSKYIPEIITAVPYLVDDIEFLYQYATLAFRDTDNEETCISQLFGLYNQSNIEAAITLGRYFKVYDEDIFSAISEYKPSMNRSQIMRRNGVQYIMDAYNANPSSMKLSIKSVMNYGHGPKTLILGDMKELGTESYQLHKEILTYIESYKWSNVYLVGESFCAADSDHKYHHYKDINELMSVHPNFENDHKGQTVLLKGSRSMALEKLLA